MKRRTFLTSGACAAVLLLGPRNSPAQSRATDWTPLKRRIGDRLIDIDSPLVECARKGGAGAEALFAQLKNPYFLSDEPSLTQSLGWVDAWTSRPSIKGVAAESAADIAAALRFARRAGIEPVVKGGGHSYFGNSNRAGSLLIWTHRLREISLHPAFRGSGWPVHAAAVPAVSIGSGCRWGEVYRTVADLGRYVQGGGCLTVGVGGFVQGGGFGSLSKQFGTGAGNLLEAEIVTADGRIRVVNQWREPELFYALRGGGGGTFAVVTRLTLRTHALPATAGAATMEVQAADDASWRELVERMIDFYAASLFNPNWGEQIRFSHRKLVRVDMVCHGLSQSEIEEIWAPFVAWVRSRPQKLSFAAEPSFMALPGRDLWNPDYLRSIAGTVLQDDRPGASPDNIYWTGNRGEAGQVIHAYQSAWLPNALLDRARQGDLVNALIRASSEWSVTLHTNKGLGGGSPEAIAATSETATNPEVLTAFALLIAGAEEQPAWPGIPGHEPNVTEGREQAAAVSRAMKPIRELVPGAGCYVSEADFFEPDWKRAHWGANYARLARTKRRYDPHWLFKGHHCVEPA